MLVVDIFFYLILTLAGLQSAAGLHLVCVYEQCTKVSGIWTTTAEDHIGLSARKGI